MRLTIDSYRLPIAAITVYNPRMNEKGNNRGKPLLWLGLLLSVPLALYAGFSAIYYAWLNAAAPERWPAERAMTWAGGAFLAFLAFFLLFIFCLISLIKQSNRANKLEEK